ncbi:hypothetical protein [Xylanibacter muris]|uniref:TIGR04255 family protein n=1 Tax=Xylanibacter muris TaxID=2736290 RepID=A0ABX2AK57_9BACT|nr:hypothetical protein [Xylanibacter muris]NPD90902.1 hypothetical protein [Xylanibacter muris]
MKPIIFNQRVTVFTNSFIGYSDTRKDIIISKLGNIGEVGVLQPNFVMVGPQQIISPNQIPLNAPWFVRYRDIRIEFQPNKIDIVSGLFINTEEDEKKRVNELTELLKGINEAISIGSITRMAYSPSLGLESVDDNSIAGYWNSIIGIPDLPNSYKQEKAIRYNAPCEQDLGMHQSLKINRVVTITEGQRTEAKTNPTNGKIENKTIECVIVSIDINTHGIDGNYSIDDVNAFCSKALTLERELIAVINNK